MKFAFSVAMRFLLSSKAQTLLIILGISIGVSVQLFIGLLIQGLQIDLVDSTIGNSSQVTIISTRDDRTIMDWQELIQRLEESALMTDITVVSPVLESPVFIVSTETSPSVLYRGLDFDRADAIYGIKDRVLQGSLPGRNEVLIGKELSEELELLIGQTITVLSSEGRTHQLVISGIFDLRVAGLNRSWVLGTLETAQTIAEKDGRISAIEMQVLEVFDADIIAASLAGAIEVDGIRVDNWKDQNQQLLSGLQGQSISSLMIQVFVIIAVALGISSILVITVVQKSRQIGILKAMGVTDRTASLVFLFEGALIGIGGAIVGVLLGLGLSIAFTTFALGPDGEPVVGLYLNYGFIALSGLIAFGASVIAAVIPARRSARLTPVEVIRNG